MTRPRKSTAVTDSKKASKEKESIKKEKEAKHEFKHEDKHGEYYNKNVKYKFKDGISCTVIYNNSKEIVERIMN